MAHKLTSQRRARAATPGASSRNTRIMTVLVSIAATVGVAAYGIYQNVQADPDLSGFLTAGFIGMLVLGATIDVIATSIMGFLAFRRPRPFAKGLAAYLIFSHGWLVLSQARFHSDFFNGEHLLFLLLFVLAIFLSVVVLRSTYKSMNDLLDN